MKYETKDSGNREEFTSGAVRDTQDDKPRYDLIPPKPLQRLAELYTRGAQKYDDHNWAKGMPTSRILSSLYRHLEAYRQGERTEDHLAAIAWNAFAIMQFEGTKWDDFYNWTPEKPPTLISEGMRQLREDYPEDFDDKRSDG